MKKHILLLCGGNFLEKRVGEAEDHVYRFVMEMEQRNEAFMTDATIFGLKVPDWLGKGRQVPRSYWESFDTDELYYKTMLRRAGKVRMIASMSMPDHALRVNQVSALCYLWNIPYQITLL